MTMALRPVLTRYWLVCGGSKSTSAAMYQMLSNDNNDLREVDSDRSTRATCRDRSELGVCRDDLALRNWYVSIISCWSLL